MISRLHGASEAFPPATWRLAFLSAVILFGGWNVVIQRLPLGRWQLLCLCWDYTTAWRTWLPPAAMTSVSVWKNAVCPNASVATLMSIEVHIDWQGQTHLVGGLHAAERGSAVSFEYAPEWLQREDAFAVDPTSLPLQRGAHHGKTLFGAFQDCGPDRWGRILIERAVRKKVLAQKPYHDVDYVLALDDVARVGALRFRFDSKSPFLAVTAGKLPPLVRLNALLRATDAIHSETETAQDLRFLLGAGSPAWRREAESRSSVWRMNG